MVLITEKQATTGQLIDDLAAAATGLTEWSDADTAISNTQATTAWEDNARVLYHSPSGQYLTLAIHDLLGDLHPSNNYTYAKGVRICVSNDWDSTNNHPAGLTESQTDDPWHADVGFDISTSFDYHYADTDTNRVSESVGTGLYYYEDRSGTRVDQASDTVTYFASIGPDYFNVAAWNTTDGTNGSAGYFTFEHVDNKFWSDGNDPYAISCQTTAGGVGSGYQFRVSHYGYKYWTQYTGLDINRAFNGHGFDPGEWGIINPDANDDTFFFQRPVVYQTNNKRVPVAYIEDSIPNDTDEGGAHGDVITHNATDYRVFRQSGAAQTEIHSLGLRYE